MPIEAWPEIAPDAVDLATPGFRCAEAVLRFGDAGRLGLPLAVAVGGRAGPAVLVAGGTHGDEYEGRIAARQLVRRLCSAPGEIAGTIVVLPEHNVLACRAGTRRGPLDDADLNRLYRPDIPGDGPSAAIARFVAEKILPRVDWVIDLHSGGVAHEFLLSANLQASPGTAKYEAMLPALLAFGAPWAILLEEEGAALAMPHAGTFEGLALSTGKRAISSELGGGGRATPESLAVAERGLENLLVHVGTLPGPAASPPTPATRLLRLGRPEHHVPAPADGVFAPRVRLGDVVRTGEALGDIYPTAPGAEPEPVIARCDGIVAGIASRGLQAEGAVLFYVAEPAA